MDNNDVLTGGLMLVALLATIVGSIYIAVTKLAFKPSHKDNYPKSN